MIASVQPVQQNGWKSRFLYHPPRALRGICGTSANRTRVCFNLTLFVSVCVAPKWIRYRFKCLRCLMYVCVCVPARDV